MKPYKPKGKNLKKEKTSHENMDIIVWSPKMKRDQDQNESTSG